MLTRRRFAATTRRLAAVSPMPAQLRCQVNGQRREGGHSGYSSPPYPAGSATPYPPSPAGPYGAHLYPSRPLPEGTNEYYYPPHSTSTADTTDSSRGPVFEPLTWSQIVLRMLGAGVMWVGLAALWNFLISPAFAITQALHRGHLVLLQAPETLSDNFFRDSIILLTKVSLFRGSQGIVINKPARVEAAPTVNGASSSSAVLRAKALPSGLSWLFTQHLAENAVFVGGPLGLDDASKPQVLHAIPNIPGANEVLPGLYLGGDQRALRRKLQEGACTPQEVLVVIGYAGWVGDQLQNELRRGAWLPALSPAPLRLNVAEPSTAAAAGGSSTDPQPAMLDRSQEGSQIVKALVRRINAAVEEFDATPPPLAALQASLTSTIGEQTSVTLDAPPPARVAKNHFRRGLEALLAERLIRDVRAAGLPSLADELQQEALTGTSARGADAGSSSNSGPDGTASESQQQTLDEVQESLAAKIRADWMQRHLKAGTNHGAPHDDAAHTPARKTLVVPAVPLFGREQKAVAAKLWHDHADCVTKGEQAKCLVTNARRLRWSDYRPYTAQWWSRVAGAPPEKKVK
jgi:putative AlgH/UPF0301 family transcriptional regulator